MAAAYESEHGLPPSPEGRGQSQEADPDRSPTAEERLSEPAVLDPAPAPAPKQSHGGGGLVASMLIGGTDEEDEEEEGGGVGGLKARGVAAGTLMGKDVMRRVTMTKRFTQLRHEVQGDEEGGGGGQQLPTRQSRRPVQSSPVRWDTGADPVAAAAVATSTSRARSTIRGQRDERDEEPAAGAGVVMTADVEGAADEEEEDEDWADEEDSIRTLEALLGLDAEPERSPRLSLNGTVSWSAAAVARDDAAAAVARARAALWNSDDEAEQDRESEEEQPEPTGRAEWTGQAGLPEKEEEKREDDEAAAAAVARARAALWDSDDEAGQDDEELYLEEEREEEELAADRHEGGLAAGGLEAVVPFDMVDYRCSAGGALAGRPRELRVMTLGGQCHRVPLPPAGTPIT